MTAAGEARQALAAVIAAGVTGTYVMLAAAAGIPPGAARNTLKEMSRCGEAGNRGRGRRSSDRGRAPAIYGQPSPAPLDALAFMREVWR